MPKPGVAVWTRALLSGAALAVIGSTTAAASPCADGAAGVRFRSQTFRPPASFEQASLTEVSEIAIELIGRPGESSRGFIALRHDAIEVGPFGDAVVLDEGPSQSYSFSTELLTSFPSPLGPICEFALRGDAGSLPGDLRLIVDTARTGLDRLLILEPGARIDYLGVYDRAVDRIDLRRLDTPPDARLDAPLLGSVELRHDGARSRPAERFGLDSTGDDEVTIRGVLGATLTLHIDGNRRRLNVLGDAMISTMAGFLTSHVRSDAMDGTDPLGVGRRRYRLVPTDDRDRDWYDDLNDALHPSPERAPEEPELEYTLVVAPTSAGEHTLLITKLITETTTKAGRIVRAIPLRDEAWRRHMVSRRVLDQSAPNESAAVEQLWRALRHGQSYDLARGHVYRVEIHAPAERIASRRALAVLSELPHLRYLTIEDWPELRESDLDVLSDLRELEAIELSGVPVSDRVLRSLHSPSSIRLSGTQTSPDAVEALRRRLPAARIDID